MTRLISSQFQTPLLNSGYLRAIPGDPVYDYGASDPGDSYSYCSDNRNSYVLLVNVEADEDPSEKCYLTFGENFGSCSNWIGTAPGSIAQLSCREYFQ